MKKIQLTLLLLLAGTIAISDPYEMGEGDPQKKSGIHQDLFHPTLFLK